MAQIRIDLRWVILLLLCFALLFLGSDVRPTWWIEMAWDANTEEDVVGYRIYHRRAEQQEIYEYLGETCEAGCVVEKLESSMEHVFVVTAYDTGGLESGFSKELRFRPDVHPDGSDSGCFISTMD